jgi:methionine sulfoxide reductase heme-binding subunit
VWFWVHWTSYLCWPVAVVHAVLNASFRGTTWWTLAVPLLSMVAIIAALVYRRRDRRRVGVPLADRGKVSEEAIRAVTGELPIARPSSSAAPALVEAEAPTELLPPVPPAGGVDGGVDAETEVLPAAGAPSRRRRVVPLAPRSDRR